MSRKYTRYGINRQYRRNPSRKRNPFPYRLPFVPDYRTNPYDSPDAGVSAATASRYRQAVEDLVIGAQKRMNKKRRFEPWESPSGLSQSSPLKRKRDQIGRNRDHRRKRSWTANKAGKFVVGSLAKYVLTGPYLEKSIDRRSYAAINEAMRVWPARGPEAAVWGAMRKFVTS